MDNSDDISKVLNALSDTASRLDHDGLGVFLEELFRWNPQLGVVSKKDTPAVVSRLFQLSICLWDFVSESAEDGHARVGRRIVDIGAGGGFPGIVWKLLVPSLDIVLLERKARKTAFLERVVARTGFDGITVVTADIRDAVRRERFRQSFDLAVMVAVAEPETLSGEITTLLADHGDFCTVRGRGQRHSGETLGGCLAQRASLDTAHGRFLLYQKIPLQD